MTYWKVALSASFSCGSLPWDFFGFVFLSKHHALNPQAKHLNLFLCGTRLLLLNAQKRLDIKETETTSIEGRRGDVV